MTDFDLAALDTFTLAEEGVPMPIVNPRTRAPILNEDGELLSITLLGRQSETFREVIRSHQQQRSELLGRNIAVTDEQREREDINTLVVCTKSWTFKILDGKDFPCTQVNIRKLWNDVRFRGLRETAISFILNDGNYLQDLSGSLKDTPGITSSSPVSFPREAPSVMSSAVTA